MDFILSKISEKDIFDKYVNQPYKFGEMIKSNLRNDDDTCSLNIFIRNGQLRYKDFGHSYGGCFEYVKKLYQCEFMDALKIIARDFNLVPGVVTIDTPKPKQRLPVDVAFDKVIIPIKRAWKQLDRDYWNNYYIPLDLLVRHEIFPANHVYLQTTPDDMFLWGAHQDYDPIYTYKIDNKYKCYRPLSKDKKFKWLSTTKMEDIQGMKQLPAKGKLLIITSSMKDLLVLKVLGYNAIALGGEGNNLPEKILDYLLACFEEIIVFYDNDKAGIMYGEKLSKHIDCRYIHIPIEFEEKDISDFVQSYGLDEGDKLMNKLIDG